MSLPSDWYWDNTAITVSKYHLRPGRLSSAHRANVFERMYLSAWNKLRTSTKQIENINYVTVLCSYFSKIIFLHTNAWEDESHSLNCIKICFFSHKITKNSGHDSHKSLLRAKPYAGIWKEDITKMYYVNISNVNHKFTPFLWWSKYLNKVRSLHILQQRSNSE